jgi:hypothetical protein
LKKENSGKKLLKKVLTGKKDSAEERLRKNEGLKLGLSPTSKKIGNSDIKLQMGKKVGHLRQIFEGALHPSLG